MSRDNFRQTTRFFPPYDPHNEINVGIAYAFSYLRWNPDIVEESLRRFLSTAQETNTPVLIKLDGEVWWDGRPDLWNWWDPSMPGYDPQNRLNVEWTSWDSSSAMKIGWRNWGRQIRIEPPPNLMSPRFQEAWRTEMDRLVPIIAQWYHQLPDEKKGLFIGLSLGWESSIGINAYHYPDGNELLDWPDSYDPSTPVQATDVLTRGFVQQGFAAVKTAGLASEGPLTEEDLAEVVRLHHTALAVQASRNGIAQRHVFSHGVGHSPGELLYDTPVTPASVPSWSFYNHAPDPMQDAAVLRNLRRRQVKEWAAAEWLLHRPVEDAASWEQALSNTIMMPGCRFLCIYNWESVDTPNSSLPAIVSRLVEGKIAERELPVQSE